MITVYANLLTADRCIGTQLIMAGETVYCLYDKQMCKFYPLQFVYPQSAQKVADLFNQRHNDYPETYLSDIEQKFSFVLSKSGRITSILPHNTVLEYFL